MKIKKMNDEECLGKFLEFLETRVSINTGFVRDEETGNITHQIVEVRCGEYVSVSQPQPLEVALRVADADELGVTLN